jgi:hypothetical protein
MRYCALLALLAAASTTSGAEAIDACSLLSGADLAELGVPADAVRSLEKQQGGVQYCRYQVPGIPNGNNSASVILSSAVPDRVLQVQAMRRKAVSESTPAQLQARGEFFALNATCKVVAVAQVETSQCLGTTEQSVVGLTLTRATVENKVLYPALQLRFISKLVSRVAERGG